MIEAVHAFLDTLAANLRLSDVIDIALVTAFFYVFISWIRQSTTPAAARRMVVVLAVFTALYLSARHFDMYLVGRVAEVFFIAFLLVLIVVFQSDLRRMLDRTGTWLFSGSSKGSSSLPIDQLTEAVAHMARERTGALIAIRGREPWDRHIQGGVKLGGYLSPPLLYSLFDHRTPGHDGALLMEGNCIVSFAAHVPLSDNVPKISEYGGTRHSAALGLSERCDAFVIVVSEERGTISVAQHGRIEEMQTPGVLRERLDRFWNAVYGEEAGSSRMGIIKHSFATATLSLAIAATLWLLFAYSPGTVFRSFEVPVEYHDVPPDWLLQQEQRLAEVTLSGPEQAFRFIDPEGLSITLNMEAPEEGWNEFTIDREDLDLPEQLALESVQPQTIRIHARPMTRVRLPVSVPTVGTLPENLQLIDVVVSPDSVTVLVLEEGTQYSEVATEPVDLSEVTEDTTVQRTLALTTEMRLPPNGDRQVEVRVDVDATEDDAP